MRLKVKKLLLYMRLKVKKLLLYRVFIFQKTPFSETVVICQLVTLFTDQKSGLLHVHSMWLIPFSFLKLFKSLFLKKFFLIFAFKTTTFYGVYDKEVVYDYAMTPAWKWNLFFFQKSFKFLFSTIFKKMITEIT